MHKDQIVFFESVQFGWMVNSATMQHVLAVSNNCRYEWLADSNGQKSNRSETNAMRAAKAMLRLKD